ncbi:hypothetical protein HYDPIDRAFT_34826 [Hydnomerulius pinastri MD-312]|uniref:Unplaced genomic scaffold scaffold_304, whole genome shotgun sequence n=1 Tax=Hydnomerulius pinastri MD-312 TaxID=994086 RepID=A0A0C9UXJ4_9AGAM|nr:hypothetical protein HYDPIDRAFT_34826 [Hydnomerulius pinastri MD-312]
MVFTQLQGADFWDEFLVRDDDKGDLGWDTNLEDDGSPTVNPTPHTTSPPHPQSPSTTVVIDRVVLVTMSASPQPASVTINHIHGQSTTSLVNHTSSSIVSPPLQSPMTACLESNSHLAQLLTSNYPPSSSASPSLPNANNGSPATHSISEAAQRAIVECEARANRTEHARDEAVARRRVLTEA